MNLHKFMNPTQFQPDNNSGRFKLLKWAVLYFEELMIYMIYLVLAYLDYYHFYEK